MSGFTDAIDELLSTPTAESYHMPLTEDEIQRNNRTRERFEATERDIVNLIEKTDSPKDKAYLLLMYKMHSSLVENTEATMRIARESTEQGAGFREFRHKEEIMFAQLRGGWKATMVMVGLFGMLLTAVQYLAWNIISNYVQNNTTVAENVNSNTKRIENMERILDTLKLQAHPELFPPPVIPPRPGVNKR